MRKVTPVVTIVLGILGVVLLLGLAYEASYWHKIYPGVSIAGVKVGNQTPAQASQALNSTLSNTGVMTLVWGTSEWTINLADIDLAYDQTATANTAFAVGRSKHILTNWQTKITSWTSGTAIDPIFSVDENKIAEKIAGIATQIDIPATEPEILVQNGQVTVTSGENGQIVDDRELLQRIKQALYRGGNVRVDIPVHQLQPKLSESQVGAVKATAANLLGKKITLTLEAQSWDLPSDQLISWIDPTETSGWRLAEIEPWIATLATTIDRPAENAYFKYVDNQRVEEFKPARQGLVVQQTDLSHQIVSALDTLVTSTSNSTIAVPVAKTEPAIQTSHVNELGIKELIGRGESNFTGSIPNRIFNLTKAANYMDGVLVAPGETFSFNKYVGDISAAGGYKQAYIIQGGRTVIGDGGGVCQVSTTMFRAALAAGLPIEERQPHAYRVSYYEQDRQPGFDAAIFTPTQDFKFINDTPGHILIQTILDPAKHSLAFEFYGTNDGRSVEISKARVWDVVPAPPPLYQDDPTLPVGQVKQVDFAAKGSKAAFDWKVVRNGEVLQQRTFYSNYRPWQAVYLKGTKV